MSIFGTLSGSPTDVRTKKASLKSAVPNPMRVSRMEVQAEKDKQIIHQFQVPKKHKAVFANAEQMKAKLKENMHKPRYCVTNFYWDQGICQAVARNQLFENITLSVISLNAIWIAVDTDLNTAEVLTEAHPVFIIAENLFCLFFSFELSVRFGAFRNKLNCMRDPWFVFDTFMVTMMVLETWVMSIIILAAGGGNSGGLGNAGMLRLLRLLRLSRMARMARLLRSMPELLILIKGMVAAIRSVFFTLLLLLILLYIFAILFRQLTMDTDVGLQFFETVVKSMNNLLLYGVFLDSLGDIIAGLNAESSKVLLLCCMYLFILLAALTVMNMLIGVLCEVVSAVAATEQEQLTIVYVKEKLWEIVQASAEENPSGGVFRGCQDQDAEARMANMRITKEVFLEILSQKDAAGLLQEVEVDVFAIVDLVDTIFAQDDGSERVLTFGDLVEVMLEYRDTKTATVKDITDIRKYIRTRMEQIDVAQTDAADKLEKRMVALGHMLEKLSHAEPGTFDKEVKKEFAIVEKEHKLKKEHMMNHEHRHSIGLPPVSENNVSKPTFQTMKSGVNLTLPTIKLFGTQQTKNLEKE